MSLRLPAAQTADATAKGLQAPQGVQFLPLPKNPASQTHVEVSVAALPLQAVRRVAFGWQAAHDAQAEPLET
jgi:hypothetical protein